MSCDVQISQTGNKFIIKPSGSGDENAARPAKKWHEIHMCISCLWIPDPSAYGFGSLSTCAEELWVEIVSCVDKILWCFQERNFAQYYSGDGEFGKKKFDFFVNSVLWLLMGMKELIMFVCMRGRPLQSMKLL